jgi:hypothetical protein
MKDKKCNDDKIKPVKSKSMSIVSKKKETKTKKK